MNKFSKELAEGMKHMKLNYDTLVSFSILSEPFSAHSSEMYLFSGSQYKSTEKGIVIQTH
jgi:hypothetical protein